MKKVSVIIIAFLILTIKSNAQIDPVLPHDSTLQERFLMSVLQDYPAEGRWIFMQIDSSYKLKNNYEVVNLLVFFSSFIKGNTNYSKSSIVYFVYNAFAEGQVFERYPDRKYPISGVKVNMRRYKTLLKKSKEKILTQYFNADKSLKKQYKKWLYEIIAVCYTNNVKVITPSNAQPYYEVFK